jgi:excisionase family DNA binding protein
MSGDIFLTVREAAALTKVTPWTVRKWIRDGKIKGYKAGGRRLLRKAELFKMIANSEPKSEAEHVDRNH